MWIGGARAIILDEKNRILMVKQSHEGREFWLLPGGGIEKGETSKEAAKREIFEETGLEVEIGKLIWHVEEVSENRGMRFVNFFLAKVTGGNLALGQDPEFDNHGQVLREVSFISKEEIMNMDKVYPEQLKDELWDLIKSEFKDHDAYKIR
jgi:8-oxo-dGTP diphosphatase